MAKRGALAHIELPDPRYIAGPSTSAATAGASAGAAAAAGASSGGESSGGSAVSGADADADGRQLRHETSNTINNIIAAKRADMNSSQSSMSFFSQESESSRIPFNTTGIGHSGFSELGALSDLGGGPGWWIWVVDLGGIIQWHCIANLMG
ncbi:hypothetical protein BSLG_003910 [Batrachochytrium salamandrivorans]|nr:hypothetical protein BSLG_003910 [Batrachochytrium salamandrivorans]